jgi:hypothetical protein
MTATTTPQAQAYAAAVRAALADLPAAEAAGLLDGLEPHLEEVAAEGGDSLVDALGPPDRYAAELRASAGLHAPAPSAAPHPAAVPPAPPLPPRRDLTAEPLAPPASEASPRTGLRAGLRSHRVVLHVGPPAQRWWGAAVLAAIVVGVLVIVMESEPLSLGEVFIRAVAIAAGWTIATAVVSRGVPVRWRDPARVVLVGAAVASALVVGANAGDDASEDAVIASDAYLMTTTVVPPLPGSLDVPQLVGLPLDVAMEQLATMGFAVEAGPIYDGDDTVLVTSQDPPPYTLAEPGSTVRLGTNPADAIGTTSTTNEFGEGPTTTAAPPTTSSTPTTAVGTTVPASTLDAGTASTVPITTPLVDPPPG